MQVLPSKAAAKKGSVSGKLSKIGIDHGNARNRPGMTAKASPGSCQRQDEHSQHKASCVTVGEMEAISYCSMSPLIRPSNVLDNAEQAPGKHSANSVWRRSVSMERGQESA